MKKVFLGLGILLTGSVFSQEQTIAPKSKEYKFSTYRSFSTGIGVGGGVGVGDKFTGRFAVGVDLNRQFKLGLNVGVSRFDDITFMPLKLSVNHQWNFTSFFIYEEIGGGYTYPVRKSENTNYGYWYSINSYKKQGGLNLEGRIGVGIPLNDKLDFRIGLNYNYQELNEEAPSDYYGNTSRIEHFYNRYEINTGFVLHR